MEKYYKEICESVEQVKDFPVTPENVLTMAALMYIKKNCEKHEGHDTAVYASAQGEDHVHPFTRHTAEAWTAGMVNADGTKGPHWTMEETDSLLKQYNLKCDSAEFWAVMNSIYSDYCEALRLSSASTPEVYVRLAKAWLHDQDAVPDKAAAYYAYIVQH